MIRFPPILSRAILGIELPPVSLYNIKNEGISTERGTTKGDFLA